MVFFHSRMRVGQKSQFENRGSKLKVHEVTWKVGDGLGDEFDLSPVGLTLHRSSVCPTERKSMPYELSVRADRPYVPESNTLF